MAEKLYALVKGQKVDNVITLLTEDVENYTITLEEGIDLIELEETVKMDWQFYLTSSNSLVSPMFLSVDNLKADLEENTDYTSYVQTLTVNQDITSFDGVQVIGLNCEVSVISSSLLNPREISLTMSITNLDFTDTLVPPQIQSIYIDSITDSLGLVHKDLVY